MVRGRGCNESFRAAIDKSYDGPEDMAEGILCFYFLLQKVSISVSVSSQFELKCLRALNEGLNPVYVLVGPD